MIRNIAIYGGAFDPPHIGHLQFISTLLSLQTIDQLWLMPCGDRTDKQLLLTKDQRFRLMARLFQNNQQKKIMSLKKGSMVHTYDLLKELKFKYNDKKFHYVVGADILHTIHLWGNTELLQKQNSFIVCHRKGFQLLKDKLPPQSVVLQVQLPEMSSSFIKGIIYNKDKSIQAKFQELNSCLSHQVLQFLREEKIL